MKKDEIKIYCKFNKSKQPIEKVICKIFGDYAENKKVQRNDSDMLKSFNN